MGDPTNIIFRSSLEYSFCVFLDKNKNIKKWGSEIIVIHYRDLQGNSHKYFTDFYYELIIDNDSNNFKRVIVEVKPERELYPPTRPKNETAKSLENYEYAVRTHVKNKLKWQAAFEYAKKRKMEFVIITEKRLQKEGIIKS